MERREPIPMSASGAFYVQRDMSELHGIRSLSNPGMAFHSNIGDGNAPGPPRAVHSNSTVLSDGVGNVGPSSVQTSTIPVRRKRGRPRKYGPGGKVSLGLSSTSATPRVMNVSMEKRGRGRPPGSGRKQQSAPPGELVSGSAGVGFTPHVITAATGEDISAKLMAFAQQGPRAVCVLSANGSVSTAILRQPSASGGTVTYEGHFDILCMSGSFLIIGDDGPWNRSGGLSILLAGPDGRVIGGGIGGMLIAASPVQVVLGSFMWSNSKRKLKTEKGIEGRGDSEHFSVDSSMGGWASPEAASLRNSHGDIDLMRG